MASKKPHSDEPTIENRKARHDYTVLETLECGIVLRGTEVKAVRAGNVSIAEGYVTAREEPPSMQLHSVNIGEYAPGGATQHAPTRARALLAHRREIVKMARKVASKGLTLVPLRLYFKNGYAKVLVGLAQGKGAHDKRQSIAKRESQRDIQRAMSKRL